MALHKIRTHPGPDVPGCFGCKAAGISIGAVTGPVAELAQREQVLARDMDAYKRMRRAGHQPAHVNGASYVEKHARSPLEMENPRVIGLSDEARQHAANAVAATTTLAPELAKDMARDGVK